MKKGHRYGESLNRRGFTLLELLVVIAIIGVLAGVITISFPGATRSARDGRRRQELQQYRVSLEIYANKSNGVYPDRATVVKPQTMCTGATSPFGSMTCPQDPKDGTATICGGTCQYRYQSAASGASYVLWAGLEKPVSSGSPCYVICSSGLSGEAACPTTPTCPW